LISNCLVIALHGLCIANHACAKDGFLLEAMKKPPSKDFAKNNSHSFIADLFSSMMYDYCFYF
jgi:hypothetical protein